MIFGVIVLSLPTFLFVWLHRDVPHFGILQDDGLYDVGAKSLAQGAGYRILSLPNQPYQTKYPPLYPLYLSLAWRTNPSFPANLPLTVVLSWLCLPAVLLLSWFWYRRCGFPDHSAWLLVALLALNPYVLFLASNLASELFFTAFVLGTVLVAEMPDRGRSNWALLAGVLAGASYLARTAGIALLPAAVIYFLWTKQGRKALWFSLGMLPAIAGWALWTRSHAAPGRDIVTLYYTNYLGYQFANVGWDNLGAVLWNNVSELLEAMGSLVFPQMIHGLAAKLILQPLAVAMLLGSIRMVRQGNRSIYPVFTAVSLAVLLVWHFAPNSRLILPLAPVLLAGFYREAAHIYNLIRGAFRRPERSQRAVAYAFAGFLVAILATGASLQILMWQVEIDQARDDRKNGQSFESIYAWIKRDLPSNANVLWENDTALYFNTEHHAAAFLIPARQWYQSESEDVIAFYRRIDEYAREQQLGYLALPKVGPHRNEEVLDAAARNTRLERIHEESGAILYQVH